MKHRIHWLAAVVLVMELLTATTAVAYLLTTLSRYMPTTSSSSGVQALLGIGLLGSQALCCIFGIAAADDDRPRDAWVIVIIVGYVQVGWAGSAYLIATYL